MHNPGKISKTCRRSLLFSLLFIFSISACLADLNAGEEGSQGKKKVLPKRLQEERVQQEQVLTVHAQGHHPQGRRIWGDQLAQTGQLQGEQLQGEQLQGEQLQGEQLQSDQRQQDQTGQQLNNLPQDYHIQGTVYCKERIPVRDLEIFLFTCPENHPYSPTLVTVTDSAGVFEMAAPGQPPHLLEIRGEGGAGRVLVSAGTTPASLEITWPVTEKIVILHTNDHHFTVNNLRETAAAINEIRNKYTDVFLFSAGDIFVRHPLRWFINGRFMRDPEWYGERAMYMITTMNELGYDLMTLGNHEFSYHEPYTRLALGSANFPLLSANVEVATDALPPLDHYALLTTSTWRKIGVLGLSLINTGRDDISELDASETVRKYLHLRDSADLLVALTHIGLRRDYVLAREFPEFDIIVGGHSHDLIEEAELVNSVLVAQAGGNPHLVSDNHPVFIGKIVVSIENGVITGKEGRVIQIFAGSEDRQALDPAFKYQEINDLHLIEEPVF